MSRTPSTPAENTARRSRHLIGACAALVIAAIVVGGVWWTNSQNQPPSDGYGSVHNSDVLVTVDDGGVVTLGKPTSTTTVEFYSDPLCPGCAAVESRSSHALAEAIDNGAITVRYHTLNFLDRASASGDYSTRVGAALLCIADTGDAHSYSTFRDTVFNSRTQPAEHGTTDRTDDDLAALARDAGASTDAVHCIATGINYERATTSAVTASDALKATGATGTPAATTGDTLIDFRNKNWVSTLTP